MQRSKEVILSALTAKGFEEGPNGRFKCPAHKGDDYNFSVIENGAVSCFSQECTTADIFKALDLWAERKPMPAGTTRYEARVGGVKVGVHGRKDDGIKKDGMWWEPKDTIHTNDLDLYQSWNLNGTKRVVVTEGERATDALRAQGIQAVGTYGKGYKPSETALAMLDGYDVVLWPDKGDEAHMTDVAGRMGREALMVDTSDPSIPYGWDAGDASPALIDLALASAKPYVPKVMRPTIVTMDELMEMSLPVERWRIDGLMQTIGTGMFIAARKSGKSIAFLQMAFCIASGQDFLEHKVEQAPVLIIEEEGGLPFFQDLAKQQYKKLGLGKGLPLHVSHRQSWRLDKDESIDALRNEIKRTGAKVVLAGPMAQLARMRESYKPEEWNAIGTNLNGLVSEFDIMMMVNHHTKKNAKPDSVNEMIDTALGSTSFSGSVDTAIGLWRPSEQPEGVMYLMSRNAEAKRFGVRLDYPLFVRDDGVLLPTKTKTAGSLAAWLWDKSDWATVDEIATGTGIPVTTLTRRLKDMQADRQIEVEVSPARGHAMRYRMKVETLAEAF